MTTTSTTDIYVKDQCGAYTTGTVLGRRASSTCSPRAAAERLAGKLFGDRLIRVEQVDEGTVYVTRWRAIAHQEK
jgi:hypothetical protein